MQPNRPSNGQTCSHVSKSREKYIRAKSLVITMDFIIDAAPIICVFSSLAVCKYYQKYQEAQTNTIIKKKKNKPNKEKRQQKRQQQQQSEQIDPVVKEFMKIINNKTEILNQLITQGQNIESKWDTEERLQLLNHLRNCLYLLESHKDKELREISTLAEKMKNIHLSDLDHFLLLFLPIERKYSKGLKDDDIVVTVEDSKISRKELPVKVSVIMDSLRSSFNVGSIFRISDCIGISHIYLCGYTATPTPENKDVIKTTMGAHEAVSWSYHKNIFELITELKKQNNFIFGLETVKDSQSIYDQDFSSPNYKDGICIVLGNERFGIAEKLLKECDQIISIPCNGMKNSLNVGVAFGVTGYEVFRQLNKI